MGDRGGNFASLAPRPAQTSLTASACNDGLGGGDGVSSAVRDWPEEWRRMSPLGEGDTRGGGVAAFAMAAKPPSGDAVTLLEAPGRLVFGSPHADPGARCLMTSLDMT